MGSLFSTLFETESSCKSGKEIVNILMVGIDGVGKTTILYQFQLGDVETINTNLSRILVLIGEQKT